MPIVVECENCKRRFQAPESALGKTGACPNCGNKIGIRPFVEPPPIVRASPEHTTKAKKDSRDNTLLIVGTVVAIATVLSIFGLLILTDAVPDRPTASVSGETKVVESVVVESEALTSQPVKYEPVESEPVKSDLVESKLEPPGLGLTLSQFKRDVPIGESWKVLSETTHENGRVVFQLLSTTMDNVMLMVTGNPEDLREVCFTFSVTTDMDQGDSLSRFAVMLLFLAKYSNWTEEELGLFWNRLLQVGAGGETDFKIQKDGHTFWMGAMGIQDGTFFMTGVSVDRESRAPTLQQWLDAHPLPVGVGLYDSSERSGSVTNSKFSFKGFRHKGSGSFVGEMTNESNENLQIATFTLSIYDSNAELLDTAPIVIPNFAAGQTKSFDTYIDSVPAQFFYKIDFESGF